MKRLTGALCAVSLTFALAACGGGANDTAAEASAATGIAGTWVAQLDSASFENDTSTYVFADGQYTCETCLPPYSVATSGEWETIDRPGADGAKIAVVDNTTVSLAYRMGEKELSNSTWTVSEDGQSMTIMTTSTSGDEPVDSSVTLKRTADGPEGSHAASGSWSFSEFGEMDEAARTFTYTLEGDTITQSSNGGGYTATLGGEAVAMENSSAGAMIKVEKLSDNVYRETMSVNDEVVNVVELTIDGDTLSGKGMDPRDESSVSWQAKRKTD